MLVIQQDLPAALTAQAAGEQVEHYSHTEVKGLATILAPKFKSEWRDITNAAREGLARVRGRPAEHTSATTVKSAEVPARSAALVA